MGGEIFIGSKCVEKGKAVTFMKTFEGVPSKSKTCLKIDKS